MVGGAVILYFAAEYTIRAVTELATAFDVGPDLIAISAMSIGTTLPKMVVSAVVTRRGRAEIAVGNVLGSCVFNAFAVVGIPAMISPLPVTSTALTIGLPFMGVATVLYFFFVAHDRKMTRWEGMLLALFYVLFVGSLFSVF
jgi:cation:H+ antiporter